MAAADELWCNQYVIGSRRKAVCEGLPTGVRRGLDAAGTGRYLDHLRLKFQKLCHGQYASNRRLEGL
jgi:hypothetical protein